MKQTVKYSISVTDKDGTSGEIIVPQGLESLIFDALKKAGAKFNFDYKTWDFGFYNPERLLPFALGDEEEYFDSENIYNSPSIAQSIREA